MELQDRVVLVTGSDGGIGEGIARLCARGGASAVKAGQGESLEQAIAIKMESHWTSVVHVEHQGIRDWNEQREPSFLDTDR